MIDIQKLKNSWMYGFFETRRDSPKSKESHLEWCATPIKNLIITNLNRDGISIQDDKEYIEIMSYIRLGIYG